MSDPLLDLPPFLSIEDFTTEYGPLTAAESATADRLLRVVSYRIRQLKDDPSLDAAQQVTFEVVRDAIAYGALEKLSSFTNITSKRQEAGAFDAAMKVVDDYLSDRHKKLLGIAVRAAPRGHFLKCDY